VGPLQDAFLIYNSQGKSKGMAVVTFQRPGDAALARTKYDGKIVDGRESLGPVFALRCSRCRTFAKQWC
jgi:THO complex subunit 4